MDYSKPASNEQEALETFKYWCEENGGTANGKIWDKGNHAGSIICNIEDRELTLSGGNTALSPEEWLEREGGSMEFKMRDADENFVSEIHRDAVNPKDIHLTDTDQELYINWKTFYVR